MSTVSVTSKGQVTIPITVRRALGIETGAKVTFTAKNGVAQLKVVKLQGKATVESGAGMLHIKANKQKPNARSLLDFDAASALLPNANHGRTAKK